MPLPITIQGGEFWDPVKEEFFEIKTQSLVLEHSLISISKWESKTHKAFLGRAEKTIDEVLFYIECMSLTPGVDSKVFRRLSENNVKEIKEYIDDPMTATTFHSANYSDGKGRIYTSELIYFYMFSWNIPIECQKWHINRLITLLKIFEEENKITQKSNPKDLAAKYLNFLSLYTLVPKFIGL